MTLSTKGKGTVSGQYLKALAQRFLTLSEIAKLTLLLLTLCPAISALQVNHDYGNISEEEWALQPPERFPNAAAVVIFVSGETRIDWATTKTSYQVRAKIFHRQGAEDLTSVEIPLREGEQLKGFKAHTVSPNGEEHKFSKFDLLKKDVGDFLTINTFTFPQVEDGCIIELQYRIYRNSSFFDKPWQFRSSYYTFESDYTFVRPDAFRYNITALNVPAAYRDPTKEETKLSRRPATSFTWHLFDLDPIGDEPFMSARTTFSPSITTEFVADLRYSSLVSGANSLDWGGMGKALSTLYEYFWKKSDLLKDLTDSVTAGLDLPRRKQAAIYNFVRDSIRTQLKDLQYGFIFQQLADDVIRNRSGTPADKNLLLVSMLSKAGIAAFPYLMASRDFSMFSSSNRSISQFNNILCLSELNGQEYILDTRNPRVIYPYLDPIMHSIGGLKIAWIGSKIIEPVLFQWPAETSLYAKVRVDANGAAVCSTRVMLRGFAQLSLQDKGKELTIDDIKATLPGTSLDHVENFHAGRVERDNADSCWCYFTMNLPDYLATADANAFARCSIMWAQPSPFKSNERTYPIDFRYPRDYEEVINIAVDSSLTIDSPPEPGQTSFGGMSYSRMPITGDHDARIVTRLKIENPFFMPSDYKGVKKFFDDVYGFNNGELVLRRTLAGDSQ